MRAAAVLLTALALLAAGCGGSGGSSAPTGQSHSVEAVSKAFYDAGIPFTSEIVTNRWIIEGQQVFLPLQLNKSDLRYNVQAQLSGTDTTTHTGIVVWVFDTDKHANDALKAVPLSKWGGGQLKITHAQLGNVIVVAAGYTGDKAKPLDKALGKLK